MHLLEASNTELGSHYCVEAKIIEEPKLTLPETNIAPENEWLEYDPFLLGRPIFRCYVSFGEGNKKVPLNLRDSEIRIQFQHMEVQYIKESPAGFCCQG